MRSAASALGSSGKTQMLEAARRGGRVVLGVTDGIGPKRMASPAEAKVKRERLTSAGNTTMHLLRQLDDGLVLVVDDGGEQTVEQHQDCRRGRAEGNPARIGTSFGRG